MNDDRTVELWPHGELINIGAFGAKVNGDILFYFRHRQLLINGIKIYFLYTKTVSLGVISMTIDCSKLKYLVLKK